MDFSARYAGAGGIDHRSINCRSGHLRERRSKGEHEKNEPKGQTPSLMHRSPPQKELKLALAYQRRRMRGQRVLQKLTHVVAGFSPRAAMRNSNIQGDRTPPEAGDYIPDFRRRRIYVQEKPRLRN